MRKNIKNKTITPFAHKAVLIPLGLFLAVIILEVGLRLGGFIFLSLQEHRNKVSIQRKDTYRIMCLGESTTAGQYPIFLQEELDKYNTGIEFSVIDKGVVAVDTSFILDKLVSNIDTYNPDMVITMMGSNDIKYPHIPYGVITTEDEQPFLNSIRIYKLARLLWRDIVVMVRKQNTAKDKVQTSFKKNTSQKQEPANQPAESGPQKNSAHIEQGLFYQDKGQLVQAEDSFKKAIELKPNSDWAYSELGWFYRSQGKFTQAEDLFKKAIELNPQNDWAYASLESIYMETGDLELAKQYGQKASELRLSYYVQTVAGNYHKLKDILDKRGITYVCVQYPVRSIEPLKKIFHGDEEVIIFVDNEKIFKDALIQGKYTDYFIDSFGGDFGHCTDKGNRLLVKNIANAILKEVFGR